MRGNIYYFFFQSYYIYLHKLLVTHDDFNKIMTHLLLYKRKEIRSKFLFTHFDLIGFILYLDAFEKEKKMEKEDKENEREKKTMKLNRS